METSQPILWVECNQKIGRNAFLAWPRWLQLETITQLMLFTSTVEVSGCGGSLKVPKATTVVHQQCIGDKPSIAEDTITLVVLAEGHNVIDSIVYDLRGHPAAVYFVQTSKSMYSSKKKGIKSLSDEVKNGYQIHPSRNTI